MNYPPPKGSGFSGEVFIKVDIQCPLCKGNKLMNIAIDDINIPAKLIINEIEYDVMVTGIKQTIEEYGEYYFDGIDKQRIPGSGGHTITQEIICEISADIPEEGEDE